MRVRQTIPQSLSTLLGTLQFSRHFYLQHDSQPDLALLLLDLVSQNDAAVADKDAKHNFVFICFDVHHLAQAASS